MEFLEKLWKCEKKHRNLRLVTTERRKNCLVLEPNYYTTNFFTEIVITNRTQILVNKLVYLGLSISYLIKTVMHEFWHDYVRPNYGENAKVCFHFLIVHVKADDMYIDIAENDEIRF